MAAIYLKSLLISERTQPCWNHLVYLANMDTFASHLLTQMGAFIPSMQVDIGSLKLEYTGGFRGVVTISYF